MKRFAPLFLILILFGSCAKEDLLDVPTSSSDIELLAREANGKGSYDCDHLSIKQISETTQDGCCTYEITHVHKLGNLSVYLSVGREVIEPDPYSGGGLNTMQPSGGPKSGGPKNSVPVSTWTIEVCEDTDIFFIDYDEKGDHPSQILCTETLSCSEPVDCCEACFNIVGQESHGGDLHTYSFNVEGLSDECQWEINGYGSKHGTISSYSASGNTIYVTAIHPDQDPAFGFKFTAVSVGDESCSQFASGYFHPWDFDENRPNECD